MTHVERRLRRLEMCRAVARGDSAPAVAKDFGVTTGLVYMFCREAGIPLPRRSSREWKPIDAKWSSADWSLSNAELARQFNVSAERVGQMRSKMGMVGKRGRKAVVAV